MLPRTAASRTSKRNVSADASSTPAATAAVQAATIIRCRRDGTMPRRQSERANAASTKTLNSMAGAANRIATVAATPGIRLTSVIAHGRP